MRKQISWGIPLGAVALALIYYSFYTPPPPVLSVHTSSLTAEVSYSLSDLETVSGTGAYIKVFLSHGDGTYWMGPESALAAHRHVYAQPNTDYTAYAEIIYAYDDNKKPPKKTNKKTFTSSGQGAAALPPNLNLAGKKITLNRTTNAVPGDSLTYIITYEHDDRCGNDTLHGTIQLTFDGGVLEADLPEAYKGEYETSRTANTIEYDIPQLLPGQQRSFFVRMKTKNSAALNSAMAPAPHVALLLSDKHDRECPNIIGVHHDTILGQTIADSHDPNRKLVELNDLCPGDSVTWRIDFQNEGNAPENEVVISDWIDPLLDYESVTVLPPPHSKFNVVSQRYNPANREWRFKMTGLNLRGLGERGVPEESTKGHILVRIKRNAHVQCNAAVNSARIFFGCNPPVFTGPAIAGFPCDSVACDTCPIFGEATLPTMDVNAGDTLILASQMDSIFGSFPSSNDWAFKWYPALGLSNAFVPNPTLGGPVNRTYTLVASRTANCGRYVIHVPVRPATPLGINIATNCSANTWDIIATATGRGPEHLVWNRCDKWVGTDMLPPPPQLPQNRLQGGLKVYFGVWDTLTDQVAEKWVLLPEECPPPPITTKWWVYALAILALAIAAVWYFQSRRQ